MLLPLNQLVRSMKSTKNHQNSKKKGKRKMSFVAVADVEKRNKWSSYDVRVFCCERDFYTCGDCRVYSRMLKFVDTHEPTRKNVELVAIDIISHSDSRYSIFEDGDVDCIANEIWEKVVYTVGIDY